MPQIFEVKIAVNANHLCTCPIHTKKSKQSELKVYLKYSLLVLPESYLK